MEVPMSTAMSAKEISEAWLKYIDDTFMIENGCGRPDVDNKFKSLEESGELGSARERDRITTDMLIAEILNGTPESRSKMFSFTGAEPLALVQDRIQCGTQLLIGFVQHETQINIEGEQALEDFFRQMLFQKPV
jgi:hypothetical protein